jgi:membrane protease YdiL (CAAX protease family)
VTPAYLVLASVMGLYLGMLFVHGGGLLAPVVTHALYDFGALLYLQRKVRRAQRGSPVGDPG